MEIGCQMSSRIGIMGYLRYIEKCGKMAVIESGSPKRGGENHIASAILIRRKIKMPDTGGALGPHDGCAFVVTNGLVYTKKP